MVIAKTITTTSIKQIMIPAIAFPRGALASPMQEKVIAKIHNNIPMFQLIQGIQPIINVMIDKINPVFPNLFVLFAM